MLDKTEGRLQYIFLGALFFVYPGLYFLCGDALFISSGSQDWNPSHFNDVRLNFDRWKYDVGGTSGVDNFYLISLSFWLPILVSKISGISVEFLMRTHYIFLPVLLIFLFYKISELLHKGEGNRILPCALLMLGGWNIFKAGLTGGGSIEFQFYYSNDFYLFFLLTLYFFIKNNIWFSGLFLFLGIMVHPAMGLVCGGFFILSLYLTCANLRLKKIFILLVFVLAGLFVQWKLIEAIFPGDMPQITTEVLWDTIINNGHLNTFRVVPSFFILSALCFFLLGYTSYRLSSDEIIGKLILIGGGWLILMFFVYNIGYLMKIPLLLKLQPLRFSSLYLFLIFLGVRFPETRTKGIFFTLFLAILFGIHSQQNPFPAKELLISKTLFTMLIVFFSGWVLAILFFPGRFVWLKNLEVKKFRQLITIILVCVSLAGPIIRWTRAVDERAINIVEASNYASENLKNKATLILWGEKKLMHGELFRTFTENPTIKPHRLGYYLYQGSKIIYDDEMRKTSILFDNSIKGFKERIEMTSKAMKYPFTKELADFYKNNFKVSHIVVFSNPGESIPSVGEKIFANKFIQIRAL